MHTLFKVPVGGNIPVIFIQWYAMMLPVAGLAIVRGYYI